MPGNLIAAGLFIYHLTSLSETNLDVCVSVPVGQTGISSPKTVGTTSSPLAMFMVVDTQSSSLVDPSSHLIGRTLKSNDP